MTLENFCISYIKWWLLCIFIIFPRYFQVISCHVCSQWRAFFFSDMLSEGDVDRGRYKGLCSYFALLSTNSIGGTLLISMLLTMQCLQRPRCILGTTGITSTSFDPYPFHIVPILLRTLGISHQSIPLPYCLNYEIYRICEKR